MKEHANETLREVNTNMRTRVILIMMLLVWALTCIPIAAATPIYQTDPTDQCAEGLRLFQEGKTKEAMSLLEAGFAGLVKTSITAPDDLGQCALALGILQSKKGNHSGALESFAAAQEIFRRIGKKGLEGAVLNNIGLIYRDQGQYDKALDAFQQALALAAETDDHASEGAVLHNIGLVYHAQGQYDKALDAFQRALMIRRAIGDHTGESAVLDSIGQVYQAQSQYDKAIDYYQQALTLLHIAGDIAGESRALSYIGGGYRDQGQYAQALDAFQQALALARSIGDHLDTSPLLTNIGVVYRDQGQYDKALDVFQQALVLARTSDDRRNESAALNNMGLTYYAQGHYSEALDVFQQALVANRAVSDRAIEGITLRNIGDVYRAQGQYAQALDVSQQSLAIRHEVGDHIGEGAVLNSIGGEYQDRGQDTEALNYYLKALILARTLHYRAGEGIALTNIGEVYQDQGQYTQALNYYQQALPILRAVRDRNGEGAALKGIGGIYHAQGHYAQALDYYQQALMLARTLRYRAGEGSTLADIGLNYYNQGQYAQARDYYEQSLTIVRAVGDRIGEGTILGRIGKLYATQGQVTQAQATQALDYFQQAMDVLEGARAVAGSEQGRASFIARYADLYESALELAHQWHQDDLAFVISERGRARAFLDSLATGIVQLSDQDAQRLLIQEQEAYAARQFAQEALARAQAANPIDPTLIADLEHQLTTATQAHDQALAAIDQRGGQLAALVPGRTKSVLDRAAVQRLLDPQTTLVAYMVGGNQTLAFVLTHDRFQTVALAVKRADLVAQVQALRAFPNTTTAIPASAVQLYQWLIAPLKPYLTTPHLAIVPHDVLHYLPFAALSDGQRFLIDDYTLTVLPSASSLPFIQQNSGHTSAAPLILGNPTSNISQLPPLNYAEEEAQTIAKLYGVSPLLGAQATARALRERATQAGIVHLAAHGIYTTTDALASAIVLAPDGSDDGQLTVSAVYGLNLHAADLVVLSACETQLGNLSAGDEVVGLTRAFFFAGTPSVLATLWSVDDQPTELLMVRFYTHLQAGMGKAAALRQAQFDVRAQYPNPYYWAGFVLSGDAGLVTGIPGGSRAPVWPWLGASALVLVAASIAGVILVRRRSTRRRQQPATQLSDQASLATDRQPPIALAETDALLRKLLARPPHPGIDHNGETGPSDRQ